MWLLYNFVWYRGSRRFLYFSVRVPWVGFFLAQRTEILRFALAAEWQSQEKNLWHRAVHSPFLLTFDQFYWITFKTVMTASISHCDHMDWHMKTWHIRVTWQNWSRLISLLLRDLLRYTSVKNVPNSRYWLSCALFDPNVVCNGGYYSLVSIIFQRISILFTVEDDNLSVGPHTNGLKNLKWLAKKSQI